MTTTEKKTVHGAAKPDRAAKPETSRADVNSAEAGESGLTPRTDGVNLFGNGQLSHEALSEHLQGLMGKEPRAMTQPEEEVEAPEESTGADADTDTPPKEPTTDPAPAEEEPAEPTEAEPEEAQPEEEETGGEEAQTKTNWPKSAIHEISEQRKRRREVETQLEEKDRELNAVKERLESEDLRRPVTPTMESPLSFADTPEKLQQWERNTRRMVSLIEDHLDGSLDETDEVQLRDYAKRSGAWNEIEESFIDGALKKIRRQAIEALQDHAPARREFFKERQKFDELVKNDTVLGNFWKDRNSQEYQDMMAVLGTVPQIRNMPAMRVAMSMYALGLQTYRKLTGQPAKGTPAKGAIPPSKTLTNGKKVVNPPGRSASVPRNNATSSQVKTQKLQEKMSSGTATQKDYEEYARLSLVGKIRAED